GARRDRLAAVGLPVRAADQPAGRPAGRGRAAARLPARRHDPAGHRQHRHLAVRRLQHAGPHRRAAGRPARAVRGRPGRRRRRTAHRLAHQDPAGAGAADPHHRLHPHRHPPALRRAAHPQAHDHRHHQRLHTQPGRLQPGLRPGQHSPRLRHGHADRHHGVRDLVRLPAAGQPEGEPRMVNRIRPGTVVVLALLFAAAAYFLLPVVWVLIAATKSTADLFGTFGLWSPDPQLGQNLSRLFGTGVFGRWIVNSFLYAGLGALAATLLSTAAGYAMAKYPFTGREALFNLVLAGVLVPPTVLALPTYLIFSEAGMTG